MKLFITDADIQCYLAEYDRLKGISSMEQVVSKLEWLQSMKISDPLIATAIVRIVETINKNFVEELKQKMPINQALVNAGVCAGNVLLLFSTALGPIYFAYGQIPKSQQKDLDTLVGEKISGETTLRKLSEIEQKACEKSFDLVFATIKDSNKLWDQIWHNAVNAVGDSETVASLCSLIVLFMFSASRLQPMRSNETGDWFDKQMNGKNLGGG